MAEAVLDHAELQPLGSGELEVRRGGTGPPILLLHGSYGWGGWEEVHDRLAAQFDVLPQMGLATARIVGFGMGGWLAAEIAVRCPHAVERLVLVDSVGIKISDRETRDIADPFIESGPRMRSEE